jgi:hypothetical protein
LECGVSMSILSHGLDLLWGFYFLGNPLGFELFLLVLADYADVGALSSGS